MLPQTMNERFRSNNRNDEKVWQSLGTSVLKRHLKFDPLRSNQRYDSKSGRNSNFIKEVICSGNSNATEDPPPLKDSHLVLPSVIRKQKY